MAKIILQGFLIIASFFALWFGLRMINWMNVFNVDQAKVSTEEKLGELYWEMFSKIEEEETRKEIIGPVDTLLTHICEANDIDRDKIKLHLIRKDDINAFALPDDHMVIFTGLISDCESEAELAGVMAHELAHMEKGHIMKKLVKEIGLSVLISMTTGNGNPEIIQQAVKILSSSAYDRNLESEADQVAVDYLIQADIDPEGFANFLFRLAAREEDFPSQLFWISTHPGSEERSKTIIEMLAGLPHEDEPVLDSLRWELLQEQVQLF